MLYELHRGLYDGTVLFKAHDLLILPLALPRFPSPSTLTHAFEMATIISQFRPNLHLFTTPRISSIAEHGVRKSVTKQLLRLAVQAEFQEDIRIAIPARPAIAEGSKDSHSDVNVAVIKHLSRLAAQAEFREDIRIAIPAIAEGPKDSHSDVHAAAIEHLSRLAAQAEFQEDVWITIPAIAKCLVFARQCLSQQNVC